METFTIEQLLVASGGKLLDGGEFGERNIEYTVKISEHSSGAFVKDVVRHAAAIDADLISIMNLHEKSLMGILGQTYEQQIITNEAQIPVLITNPIETRVVRGSVFSS